MLSPLEAWDLQLFSEMGHPPTSPSVPSSLGRVCPDLQLSHCLFCKPDPYADLTRSYCNKLLTHAEILHAVRMLSEQDQEPEIPFQTMSWPYGPTAFASISPSVSEGDKSEFTGERGDLLVDVCVVL